MDTSLNLTNLFSNSKTFPPMPTGRCFKKPRAHRMSERQWKRHWSPPHRGVVALNARERERDDDDDDDDADDDDFDDDDGDDDGDGADSDDDK